MEKNIENEMNQAKSLVKIIIGSFHTNGKTLDDAVLCIAAIFYLGKRNALTVKKEIDVDESKEVAFHYCKTTKECLCYYRTIVENEGSPEFRILLDKYITEGRTGVDSRHIVALGRVLIENDFTGNDLLSLLDYTQGNFDKRQNGGSFLPKELLDLVEFFFRKDSKRIFDPFGSMLDFAISHPDRHLTAIEINGGLWELGLFRLAIAGIIEQTQYIHSSGEEWIKETFDTVITVPPFGVKLRMGRLNTAEDAESVAFKYFIGQTNQQTGQMISIVPMSFLSAESGNKDDLRSVITENNWLDTVVYLPRNIFPNTGIATALVILNKQRKAGQKISFLDATKCYKKSRPNNILDIDAILHLYHESALEFTKEAILDKGSSWDLQWEIEQRNAKFNDSDTIVKVADVMTQISSQTTFDDTEGRIVGVKELAGDVYQFEKKPEDFPIAEVKGITSKVVEPVILLSLVNVPKPTYCIASEQSPIFIKNDVCAYRITSQNIHIGYLCLELSKRLKAFNGTVIPRLTRSQILNTLIGFPSLDSQRSIVEQKNIFEESLRTAQMSKAKELGLEALLEKQKKEYIEEVRNRKHDMKTPMGQLRSTLKLLESLANQLSGEPAEKLHLYVQRQKRAMDTLSKIVSHIADVDEFTAPEPIDLSEVLASCQTTTEKYAVAYYPDEAVLQEAGLTKPMVMMGKSELLRLIQNIIGNAIERGFVDDYPEYSLNISLTIKEGFYIIDFSNNGRPLPEGMTKERYGMKGVKGKGSDGEGKGGYIVKSITEHYGGDYDVYSQQFAGMWFTHVIVKLPIYQDNE